MAELRHYSGATFYYAGEWYWGVDRLFYLEARLQELAANKTGVNDYLVPRPDIDVSGVDASALTLDFYPSLNSPYTSIIFDKTIAVKNACNIAFNHKPVLPMIMRGVASHQHQGHLYFLRHQARRRISGRALRPHYHADRRTDARRLRASALGLRTGQGRSPDEFAVTRGMERGHTIAQEIRHAPRGETRRARLE